MLETETDLKWGGSGISGHHVLKNSITYENKAKGIDSNSCPDIEIYNNVSFNNEGPNIAIYTANRADTAYVAERGIFPMAQGKATVRTFS